MDAKSKIGIRIKELRESNRISQKDLAYMRALHNPHFIL